MFRIALRSSLVYAAADVSADYQQAAAVLGQKELADVTMAVALMNAFNRIGVGMRLVPAALAR